MKPVINFVPLQMGHGFIPVPLQVAHPSSFPLNFLAARFPLERCFGTPNPRPAPVPAIMSAPWAAVAMMGRATFGALAQHAAHSTRFIWVKKSRACAGSSVVKWDGVGARFGFCKCCKVLHDAWCLRFTREERAST